MHRQNPRPTPDGIPAQLPDRAARRDRRGVRGAAVALTLLVASGGAARASTTEPDDAPSDEATATGQPTTRTVETEMGPVDIPADPQHIVALDEYAAMNMLALGIEPAVVYGSYNDQISQQVLTSIGIEVAAASVDGGVNFEAVAAAEPDLVVISAEPGFGGPQSYDTLSEIAPTVLLPLQQPWRDTVDATAAVFDRQAEGDHLVDLLEERIDHLAAEVRTEGPSISLLGNILQMPFAVSDEAPLSALVAELGFTRPLAQAEGTPFEGYRSVIAISPEVVGEHDADIVVVFSGNDFDAGAVTSLPTFQALPAVVDGRSFEVDGNMWFGTFPFAVFWILDDVAALSGSDGQATLGTIDDTDARWADFQAMTG